MEFRQYCESDYDAVCDFLIALNAADRRHINWNWARFEWMYEHPECDRTLLGSIGLWIDGGAVVGAAIYDMYFGEAFCAALPAYASLYPEILTYAYGAMRDDAGLAVAIPDDCACEIEAAKRLGFAPTEQTETIMAIDLDARRAAALPDGLGIAEPDPVKDDEALQWLFWQGFDHGSDREAFLREKQPASRPRRHFNPHLGPAAVNEAGEYVACCCLWYEGRTDYAYVEPVCTIPAYRGKGVAKALLYEAMNRARALGAKRAYVISDMPFYEALGFRKERHYTFYRKG